MRWKKRSLGPLHCSKRESPFFTDIRAISLDFPSRIITFLHLRWSPFLEVDTHALPSCEDCLWFQRKILYARILMLEVVRISFSSIVLIVDHAPDKSVFRIVTDNLNYPAMTMWFLVNPPSQSTIQIQSIDDFKWLPPDFSSTIKQSGVRDPRFISPLNHLRFYLPDIFPYLNKVLLLEHDVVVQKDLRDLWKIDMKGKVIAVVETCEEDGSSHRMDTLVDFSEPTIAKNFDAKACLWAFGMNIFDVHEWGRRGLTQIYNKWLQLWMPEAIHRL